MPVPTEDRPAPSVMLEARTKSPKTLKGETSKVTFPFPTPTVNVSSEFPSNTEYPNAVAVSGFPVMVTFLKLRLPAKACWPILSTEAGIVSEVMPDPVIAATPNVLSVLGNSTEVTPAAFRNELL